MSESCSSGGRQPRSAGYDERCLLPSLQSAQWVNILTHMLSSKNIISSWGLSNYFKLPRIRQKTSFQVKIDHEITKIPHFPKTCIKIADFTKPLPSPIYVGIFTHDLKSTVRPSLSFQINLIAMTHGRGDAAPAPASAQQLQLYLAPASKNRCEVRGELIFISTQRELWTQTLKQATNDDWQGGIFTACK